MYLELVSSTFCVKKDDVGSVSVLSEVFFSLTSTSEFRVLFIAEGIENLTVLTLSGDKCFLLLVLS